jgi:hypothetical protein
VALFFFINTYFFSNKHRGKTKKKKKKKTPWEFVVNTDFAANGALPFKDFILVNRSIIAHVVPSYVC